MKKKILFVFLLFLAKLSTLNAQEWQQVNLPAPIDFGFNPDFTYFNNFYFTDKNKGYVFAYYTPPAQQYWRTMIFYTDDGTETWSMAWNGAFTNVFDHGKLHFVNKNIGFLLEYKTLYKTVDGCRTWTTVDNTCEDTCGRWNQPFFTDANNGIITTNKGVVSTTDGGATWEFNEISNGSSNISIQKFDIDPVTGIGLGISGLKGYSTRDFGKTWSPTSFTMPTTASSQSNGLYGVDRHGFFFGSWYYGDTGYPSGYEGVNHYTTATGWKRINNIQVFGAIGYVHDNLIFSDNNGKVYRITDYDEPTPNFELAFEFFGNMRNYFFFDEEIGYAFSSSAEGQLFKYTPNNLSSPENSLLKETCTIYTNKSNGNLVIIINNSILGKGTIELFTITGKVIKKIDIDKKIQLLDIELVNDSLPKGIYFARISIENNSITKKVLIQ